MYKAPPPSQPNRNYNLPVLIVGIISMTFIGYRMNRVLADNEFKSLIVAVTIIALFAVTIKLASRMA